MSGALAALSAAFANAKPLNFSGTISFTSGTASANDRIGVTFNSDGSIDAYKTGSGVFFTDTISDKNWYFPNYTDVGSWYWLRFTTQSGSLISGTPSGWVHIYSYSPQSFYVTRPTIGSRTGTLLVEISPNQSTIAASGTVLISTNQI